MPPVLTPQTFVAKWEHVTLNEKAVAQSHFNELCQLLGQLTPTDADPDVIIGTPPFLGDKKMRRELEEHPTALLDLAVQRRAWFIAVFLAVRHSNNSLRDGLLFLDHNVDGTLMAKLSQIQDAHPRYNSRS